MRTGIFVPHPTEPWGRFIPCQFSGSDPALTPDEKLISALWVQVLDLHRELLELKTGTA